ncbi:hypothetical protein RSW31_26550, partial [Escherichia coli]|uniref:hypothetical protein n=1 Tax=Escherichia coli TaxID=562 RepID=UPI0028DD7E79
GAEFPTKPGPGGFLGELVAWDPIANKKVWHAAARAADSIVILTDPSGLVLDTVGSADFAVRAAKVALRPGVSWSEAE